MTLFLPIVLHGGSVLDVREGDIQNMPFIHTLKLTIQIWLFSMEAAATTACTAKTGIIEGLQAG